MSALPEHVELRERIERGETLGPRLLLSRMVDGAGRAWPPPISTWVSSPEEARQAVLDSHQQGYDSIKVYSFLDRASYEAIMTTAAQIGMPVGGHIPYELSLEEVLEGRTDSDRPQRRGDENRSEPLQPGSNRGDCEDHHRQRGVDHPDPHDESQHHRSARGLRLRTRPAGGPLPPSDGSRHLVIHLHQSVSAHPTGSTDRHTGRVPAVPTSADARA